VAEAEGATLGEVLRRQVGAGAGELRVEEVVVLADVHAHRVVPQAALEGAWGGPQQVVVEFDVARARVEVHDAELVDAHRGGVDRQAVDADVLAVAQVEGELAALGLDVPWLAVPFREEVEGVILPVPFAWAVEGGAVADDHPAALLGLVAPVGAGEPPGAFAGCVALLVVVAACCGQAGPSRARDGIPWVQDGPFGVMVHWTAGTVQAM